MKHIISILLALLIINCSAQHKTKAENINVLFIGNSFTYFYDMPQTVQKMLNETDPNIKIEQSTFPGQSLSGHLSQIVTSRTENGISTRQKEQGEKTETEIKIAEKKWNVVILQTGTVNVIIPENRELKINKAVLEIKKQISNPDCKFILFNTWSDKDKYPKQYCYPSSVIDKSIEKDKCCSPVIENLEQEVKIINEGYNLLAKECELLKSENGNKFYEVRTQYPKIELYEDESHPNKYGAFLNACIFYQMLTNKKALKLKYNGEIEPEIAKLLKEIAE
jgi:hypothetical protein